MCSTMKFAANEVNAMPSTITKSSAEMGCKGHPLTRCRVMFYNKFQLSICTIYCWVYPIIDPCETSFFILGFPHDHTINYDFWDGCPTLSHFYSMIKHDRPRITAGPRLDGCRHHISIFLKLLGGAKFGRDMPDTWLTKKPHFLAIVS